MFNPRMDTVDKASLWVSITIALLCSLCHAGEQEINNNGRRNAGRCFMGVEGRDSSWIMDHGSWPVVYRSHTFSIKKMKSIPYCDGCVRDGTWLMDHGSWPVVWLL